LRGGLPERIGATIVVFGSTLTVAAVSSLDRRYGSVEFGVFLVDVAGLVALVLLALRSERYWPLWVAALHLIGMAGHGLKLADPDVIRRAYAFAMQFWGYPMLLLIALGTWRHQQRLKRFGFDPSWSRSPPSAASPSSH
ncbi:MAG TPA: hypothetical protein VJS15_09495, partial [Allosphingosinicella sp.]|nr:hypothetical protein [Allosphingosinicella sp.]